MDLAEFLLARIAEDEQVAQDCAPQEPGFDDGAGRWTARDAVGHDSEIFDADETLLAEVWGASEAEHIARHDPTRVLAECDAKRRIVALADGEARSAAAIDAEAGDQDGRLYDTANAMLDALRLLALPYAAHPSYNESWRPLPQSNGSPSSDTKAYTTSPPRE